MNRHAISCKYCNEIFYDRDEHERHLKSKHNVLRWYVCKKCQEKVYGTDNFDKHLQFTHGTNHWDINLALKQTKRTLRKLFDK